MFLDREVTPELGRELIKQQIVVARSSDEARIMGRAIGNSFDITVDSSAIILTDILKAWKGVGASWQELKGLRVLDLASGSGNSHDGYGTWYPHFSRLCAINGANVVAIDVNPQRGLDETMFAWAQEDLVDVVLNGGLKSMPILQEKEFDIIHSANFVGTNFFPELPTQLSQHGVSMPDFEKTFAQQAKALLTEGGVIFLGDLDERWDPIIYTKRESDVVTLGVSRPKAEPIIPYHL
jgi:hypothetical protein